ncbi:MAG: hypothetical protein V4466_05155 [Pseudomonadota bacterium]
MAQLIVGTWSWGTKYGPEYVDRLRAGVARHLTLDHQFRVFAPHADDQALTGIPGCFARLRAFDPAWQAANEVHGRLVCLDLDLIVTGSLDGLFSRSAPFGILQGVNASNPGKFNGSAWWTTAGYRPDVWSDFSLEAAAEVPHFEFPDDQAWLEARLPDAAAFGPQDGAYAFCKPGWPKGTALPKNAALVAFPGWRDPVGFQHLEWVKEHWVK